eukprot:Hpha_TRINITY_DN30811_c0_g1::TRINITY_DN30811_c0_g1_i1::g.155518::m.155518
MKRTGVLMAKGGGTGKKASMANQWIHDNQIRHRHNPGRSSRMVKTSTGPYGNRFMLYLGLNRGKWALMAAYKAFARAEESQKAREEVQERARLYCSPEWQWKAQDEKDPYSPTPLILRRFMQEAKNRRRFVDRRMPWLEEMMGEDIESKPSAKFRAFPDQPRPQERMYPGLYRKASREEILRKRTPEEVEAMCRPADTYYTRPMGEVLDEMTQKFGDAVAPTSTPHERTSLA